MKLESFKDFRIFEGKKKFPNLKKIDIDGFEILIGRDSESNDYLTMILADDEDLWLHAKGVPGSHVVIRQGDKIASDGIKKKAATEAVKMSKATSGRVPVVCCKAKFVTKDKWMPPGKVNIDYNNVEIIHIEN